MTDSTHGDGVAFLCDHMLGTLSKWLRILGFDASYPRQLSDDELLELAKSEGRILLTRDKDLLGRRNVRTIYVSSDDLDGQVGQVLRDLDLVIENPLSRCPVCNEDVVAVPREEVSGKVPEGVYERHEEFWSCTGCGRYYWQGTHWDGIRRKVEQYRAISGSASKDGGQTL